MIQHLTACGACPWRRTSIAGYLGADTPEGFLATSEAEVRMPCHVTVDYEDPNWEENQEYAPQCAGRAAHFANRCKLPRNPALMRGVPDPNVFTFPQEFLDHHLSLKRSKE